MISIQLCLILLFWSFDQIKQVQSNRPPRFLIDGQTEIVLRLKEGSETPVGKLHHFDYTISLSNVIHI